ncbi:MAG TPA: hypothetical protein VGH54_07765 [Mycobacterium sp.]|jgi:hypothetical protein|uniref:hypothetical protein n=1 Tax=Mycobacterium sp. TaxID=1785 RepID=UPI002F42FC16
MPDTSPAHPRLHHDLRDPTDRQRHSREEFFDLMLQRFPAYANPKALWRSIVALTNQDAKYGRDS